MDSQIEIPGPPLDLPNGAPAARQHTRERPAVRPRDIERAVQGVQNAGLKVSGVQFYPDGGIRRVDRCDAGAGADPAPGVEGEACGSGLNASTGSRCASLTAVW